MKIETNFEDTLNAYDINVESHYDEEKAVDAEFLASIEQARKVGVPEDKILKSIEDIDDFFMGG